MINRMTKLRWRRRLRLGKRQVEDFSINAEEHLDRHLFRRLGRLVQVRRFVVSWIALFILLIIGITVQLRGLGQYYQVFKPAVGGTFTEGVLGTFTNANPLYATNPVDSSVARLVFSGLMRYDHQSNLVGDLAESLTVDDRGTHYIVTLRKNIVWHDGRSLTADDVVFTYQTIQNPDAKSPLFYSWQGIKVEAKDSLTVVFTLPNALSSFKYSLTNGIVPKHLLVGIPAAQLRSAGFNVSRPVGSGPFKWETIEVRGNNPDDREEQVGLVPNGAFYRGQPKLQHFIVRAFHNEQHLLESLNSRELNGAAGLETIPDNLKSITDIKTYNIPINGEVLAFFKTTQPLLSDQRVRQALVMAVDVNAAIKKINSSVSIAKSPLLKSQPGYDKNIVQFPQNIAEANRLLDDAGWLKGKDGLRAKGSTKLNLQLYSQNTSDYTAIAQSLRDQWRAIGVDVKVTLQPDSDLQVSISSHAYDVLLFGISIGSDPDVFPFWHSSQADPRSANRLNLSEYTSKQADAALEAGRTRSDPAVRSAKYRSFLEAWRVDAPALVLYEPNFLYASYGGIFGFDSSLINHATDRYANVENWMILQEKVAK